MHEHLPFFSATFHQDLDSQERVMLPHDSSSCYLEVFVEDSHGLQLAELRNQSRQAVKKGPGGEDWVGKIGMWNGRGYQIR